MLSVDEELAKVRATFAHVENPTARKILEAGLKARGLVPPEPPSDWQARAMLACGKKARGEVLSEQDQKDLARLNREYPS
jgi:hypothetical protein